MKPHPLNDHARVKKTVPSQEKFATIKRLVEIFPSFTGGGIRSMIFSNEWNFEGECIMRAGRKILIDVEAFESWIRKPKMKEQKYSHLSNKSR